jgi:osmoprotectant transport system substrate-binding protein
MRLRGATAFVAALVLVGSSTTGCGLDSNYRLPFEVRPGSIQPVPELIDVDITVGSKEFTENLVLGYLAEIALTAAGADISDLTNIQGTNGARFALLGGDIDLYWDYTGTGWIVHLGQTDPVSDERRQFEVVRDGDLAAHQVVWLDYSPVNDTYAFATTRKFAAENHLVTNSDLVELLRADPTKGTFCLETEFISRKDGLPGVTAAYGFEVLPDNVKNFGTGAIYAAVVNGTCNFGEVFTTDGRILALDLVVLEDDRKFFPQYNAAVTMRKDFLDAHPKVRDVLEPISRRLDNGAMRLLNAEVDVYGKDPAIVARDWLVREGFIGAAAD